MSSMVNYKTFTRALTLFCLIVFAYTLIPNDLQWIESLLKYTIIIFVIIILMMYNKILSGIQNNRQSQNISNHDEMMNSKMGDSESFKKSFKELTDKVLSLSNSISSKYSTAIYIIDPEKQSFILQTDDNNIFLDTIPLTNTTIQKFNFKDKKFHQKDNPEEWNKIFRSQNWRGSECAIFCPISLKNNIAGFVLTRVEHFTDINQKEQHSHNELGGFISFGLETLGRLEQRVIGEENKSLILDILSNIDFKSDNQIIYNKFKFLIVSFFKYDRLTISFRKESENRREYDKGLNLTIKVIDGEKDVYNEGDDYPTNGSLHGLPVVDGRSIRTENWQNSHNNLFRFSSSESSEHLYKSILGVPIPVNEQNKGSIVLERRSSLSIFKYG